MQPAFDGPGAEVAGRFVGRAADREVDAVERIGRQFFDRVFLAVERELLAGAALRGEELDVASRGKLRSSSNWRMMVPTAPVAPTMASESNTTNSE